MALNVFIRGLSSRGFRVKNASGARKTVKDRDQAGAVNAIQVDVDVAETQRILSREMDNFIRAADATTTTIAIRGLHRRGFRIKDSTGAVKTVKRGTTVTVDVADGETRRLLRRNKREWIRMPSATATAVQVRGLEAGAEATPRGVAFQVRDLGTKATGDLVSGGANNDIRLTAAAAGTGGNKLSGTIINQGGTNARSITVNGNVIEIRPATTTGAINAGETATALAAAVNANAAASALVSASAPEGTGAGTVTAVASTPLAGGNFEGSTLTNVRAGTSVTVRPDEPETASMLRRHHKKWIEVDA